MDRLTAIEVFVRVVRTGTLAGAARASGLSAGMIGKHLHALETRLGTRLLNRTTRRLSLTDTGRAYYERCQRLLTDIDEANREAIEQHTVPRGSILVNAPIAFGELHLAGAIADFTAKHDAVSIDVTLNNYQVDMLDGSCDVAIRIGKLADSDLIARRLAACRRVICASPAYLERHGTPKKPGDLLGHNCLTHLSDTDAEAWRLGGPNGEERIQINGRLKVNSGGFLREIALASGGIVRLPTFIVGKDIKAGRLVPLLTEFEDEDLGIYAVFRSSRQVSAKIRLFVEFLSQRFARSPSWDRLEEEAEAPVA